MTWPTFYLICFLLGLGLSAVSFFSGLHRLDLFHHFGGHGHGSGAGHHLGGNHGAHASHAPHAVAHQPQSPHAARALAAQQLSQPASSPTVELAAIHVSPFNMAAITAFLAWFGGSGVVFGMATHWAALPVFGISAAAGVAGGAIINRFLGGLLQRERPMTATSMIGLIGRLSSSIRAGGTGEIVFLIEGTRHVAAARSDAGHALAKGTEVIITRYDKGIAYVCTWDEIRESTPSPLPEQTGEASSPQREAEGGILR